MNYWMTAYDAGQWANYELVLVSIAGALVIFWFILTRFKPQGLIRGSLVILCCIGVSGSCLASRVYALQLSSLLTYGKNIEILDGEYRYGKYHFPYDSAHGIGYREVHIGHRVLKLYHSGYLEDSRCYRDFYNSNHFDEGIQLRLYIHWFEHELVHRNVVERIKTPCILRIEQHHSA